MTEQTTPTLVGAIRRAFRQPYLLDLIRPLTFGVVTGYMIGRGDDLGRAVIIGGLVLAGYVAAMVYWTVQDWQGND